jgi:hypothetical protein
MKDPVKYLAIFHKKQWDRTVIYPQPQYLFESGPMATFSREFHSWWKKHDQYPGSLLKNIKLRLKPTTNFTSARYLISKKPPRHILRMMKQPNK